jgi:hypothetical protein
MVQDTSDKQQLFLGIRCVIFEIYTKAGSKRTGQKELKRHQMDQLRYEFTENEKEETP